MFKKEKADLHLQIQEHALPDILVVFQLARLQLVNYLFDRTGRFFLNVKNGSPLYVTPPPPHPSLYALT